MSITHINQLDLEGVYTYADYLTWNIKDRLELLRGRIVLMSPAPNLRHQQISGNFHGIIWNHLKSNPCQVFAAPFDVRLSKEQEELNIHTVVQPDVCVVCDESKLDEKGCLGAPDLIIEILSPGNSHKEFRDKYNLYQDSGVKEYWIVNPQNNSLQVFVRNTEGLFIGKQPLTDLDEVSTDILPGLNIELKEVF